MFALALSPGAARLASQVVDPGGAWRTFRTGHFEVHTQATHLEAAARAAAVAESAWTALAALLPPPRGRIHLVIADHWDLANGFASTWPSPRVVIQAAPPVADPMLGDYDSWLALVITHELAHIFHLEPARGWWRWGRALLGRAPFLFPNVYAPSWVSEGLAVYYETRLTGGGRLRSGFHHAAIAAQLEERGPLPMDAAGGLSPRWPGGVRPYVFGAQFFADLAAAGGDSAVARFVRLQSSRPLPWLQVGAAFRGAMEKREKREEREKREKREVEARVVFARQRSFVAPRVAADGRIAALYDDGRSVPRIVVIDGAGVREVARVNAVTSLAWEGDDALIVSQLEFVNAAEVRGDLWRIRLDGGRERLTSGARLREADVARDGAIVAVRLTAQGTELVLVRGGEASVLAPAGAGVEWAQPRFAPGGERIAAVRVVNGRRDIVLLNRDGGAPEAVTSDDEADIMPAWSDAALPALLWVREVNGRPAIVRMNLRTRESFAVARPPFAAWAPAAAGDSLIYLSQHADGLRLVVAAPAPWPVSIAAPEPGPADREPEPGGAGIPATSGYSPLGTLLPRYWLPLASGGTGGAWYGALSSGTDVLERWWWAALVQAGGGVASGHLRGSFALVHSLSRPLSLDAWYSRDQLAWQDETGNIGCCVLDETAELGATLVRPRWRHSLSMRGALLQDRFGPFERRGVSLSLGVSTASRPPFAISRQEGARASGTVRHRRRVGEGRSSTEYTARVQAYLAWGAAAPGGGGEGGSAGGAFARQVTALRLSGGVITGNDPVRYLAGGNPAEGVSLAPGLALGGSRSFPLRGAAAGEYGGRRILAASLEHRIPLALVGRGLPGFIPVQLDRLSVSLFGDGLLTSLSGTGNRYASLGAELVFDLGAGADVPVRLRFGTARRLDTDRLRFFAAAGAAF
jgi:hypothetical protein